MISENALKLKEYLERLTNGENLETVRADFVSDFKNASYNDVLIAEEGISLSSARWQLGKSVGRI